MQHVGNTTYPISTTDASLFVRVLDGAVVLIDEFLFWGGCTVKCLVFGICAYVCTGLREDKNMFPLNCCAESTSTCTGSSPFSGPSYG